MNTVRAFVERQLGNYNGRNYDTPLCRLAVHASDSWRGIAPSQDGVDFNPEPPIFTAKFAKCLNHRHMLAIANEDGRIALQNTDERSSAPETERQLTGQQCHHNAVFDLEWMPGAMKFISASGDHTARLWEVRDGGGGGGGATQFECTRIFSGHTRSVKTAAFRKTDAAVFATGGRDGAILIWDTRVALNVGAVPRADNCIYSGHSGGPGTPASACKRGRGSAASAAAARQLGAPKLPPNVSSSSITGLVFQDDTTLVSCGAGDGIIKVWDLRRNYTSYKKEPLPKHSIPYPGTSTFKGYTNLMVDEAGVRLYVNCMDNSIYAYNLGAYPAEPLRRYTGLRNSTFYIKSSLSPDGRYLLSGSSDERAYVWNVDEAEPLVALVGHTVEVTCVAWSHADEMRVVTCSDDARHKIWRIGAEVLPADEAAMNYRGRAERCDAYWPAVKRRRTGTEPTMRPKEAAVGRGGGGPVLRARAGIVNNTPRSLRRLVSENETTPQSAEKASAQKRRFADVDGDDDDDDENAGGTKRPHLESKGRRLFSPAGASAAGGGVSTASVSGGASVFYGGRHSITGSNLAAILEEPDASPVAAFMSTLTTPTHQHAAGEQTPPTASATTTASSASAVAANSFYRPTASTTKQLFVSPPFTERHASNQITSPETPPNYQHQHLHASAVHTFAATPSSTAAAAAAATTPLCYMSPYARAALSAAAATSPQMTYSPTSNLPNYVINGEAPHLQLQSPKRKLKENVDWLTKIRKQKLLSTINAQLNEKLSADDSVAAAAASMAAGLQTMAAVGGGGSTAAALVRCESPRQQTLQTLRFNGSDSVAHNVPTSSPSTVATTAAHTPRRRTSRSASDAANRTPTSSSSSRAPRNPEHTLLRFFSRKTVTQSQTAASAAAATSTSTDIDAKRTGGATSNAAD